jgi:hypothetical protein
MSRPRGPSEGKRDELEVLDPASVLGILADNTDAGFQFRGHVRRRGLKAHRRVVGEVEVKGRA